MASFSMCDGEDCWAAGWLQHSFTISSNISADAVQLVNLGLEGPLTQDMSPDSFPTRYVPFHPSVIVVFFVLIGTLLLHELYASYHKPILTNHEQSSNTLVQSAFLALSFLITIYNAMMIPVSLDFSLQMGQSSTMSGVFLSSPLIGSLVGLSFGASLVSEADWNQPFARQLLVLAPFLSTFFMLANAYLVNTAGERSLADRKWAFWMTLLLMQGQVFMSSVPAVPMTVMRNKMTRNSEKTFWQILIQSFMNSGLLVGPGVLGAVAYALKAGHPLSPASLLAWVNVVLGLIWVLFSNFLSWTLPTVLVPVPEDVPSPEGEVCVTMLPAAQRETVVKNMIWYSIEREFFVAAIEVGSIMLLEVSYGWTAELSGTLFTVVSVSSLVFSLISSVFLSFGWLAESTVFFGGTCLGLFGVMFMFEVGPGLPGAGPAGLLFADGLVYGMASVCNCVAFGWAMKAAIPGTNFSVEVFQLWLAFGVCGVRFVAPILVRALVDFGGRNVYAGIQFLFVLVSTLTVYETVSMVWQNKFDGEEKADKALKDEPNQKRDER